MKHHIMIIAEEGAWQPIAVEKALVSHYPDYEDDSSCRTRISVLVPHEKEIHDFVFEHQELMDNSYWRIVELGPDKPQTRLHRPQYEGMRKDFVDIEWEFIIGYLSHPILQQKLRHWTSDSSQQLDVCIAYSNAKKSRSIADKFKRRLPETVNIDILDHNPEADAKRNTQLMEMAKYLHYFYQASYALNHVPTELPEEEVQREWDAIENEKLKMSNIYNVMSIPVKMEILGHDRNDWSTFYAMTAEEIDQLTAVEHNRWSVERLIQGMRPCTEQERKEVAEDLRRRLSDAEYTKSSPVSLKKKYKNERNAHYDLCAFSELGVDETGLPVTRYDRDLTAAIPLIVKAYNDRHSNG